MDPNRVWTYDCRETDESVKEELRDGVLVFNFSWVNEDPVPNDVRKRMAWFYGCSPNDREMQAQAVYNQYDSVGSVYFSLSGSPPKSHAIYVVDSGRVFFYGPHGEQYAKWKNVSDLGKIASV